MIKVEVFNVRIKSSSEDLKYRSDISRKKRNITMKVNEGQQKYDPIS